MKKILLMTFFIMHILCFSGAITEKADVLIYKGKYKDALKILQKQFKNDKTNEKLAWKIAQTSFFLSQKISSKKDRFEYYDIGIDACFPFLDKPYSKKRDRAELIHWYSACYASKIKDLGIFAGQEGLAVIPKVFELMDKCIETDSDYSGAYFFKGKLYGDVPGFLGGNKLRMETNYSLALKYANEYEKPVFLIDIAESLLKRNWSIEHKLEELKKGKVKQDNLLSLDKNDHELAVFYLEEAVSILERKDNPSLTEKEALKKAEIFYKKVNK